MREAPGGWEDLLRTRGSVLEAEEEAARASASLEAISSCPREVSRVGDRHRVS